jgi:thiamine-monophosphate kinase
MTNRQLASDLGERGILKALVWPRLWPNSELFSRDDAAVLPLDENSFLLMSIDAGPQQPFLTKLGIGSFQDLGHYYATMSLSDIAAMGGQPSALVAALLLPHDSEAAAIKAIIDGILTACAEAGAEYVGGDTKQADSLRVITSVLGHVPREQVLARRGLATGDLICTSGPIGRTLASYLNAASGGSDEHELYRPKAKVEFARALARSGVATTCIDMSDGPLASARELAEVNMAKIEIDVNELGFDSFRPVGVSQSEWASLILQVGGDFELMFSVPQQARSLIEDLGGLVCGTVTKSYTEPNVSLGGLAEKTRFVAWENFLSADVLINNLIHMVRR